MNPMTWGMVLSLVEKYGPSILALAEKLWQLAASGGAPTQADWDALGMIAAQTANSQMKDALIRAGIDLNSPQAVALLDLTKV